MGNKDGTAAVYTGSRPKSWLFGVVNVTVREINKGVVMHISRRRMVGSRCSASLRV